jgi:hypothetical protein
MTQPYGESRGSSHAPGAWKRGVEQQLDKIHLGPWRIRYSRDGDVLQFQVMDQSQTRYVSVFEISRGGNIRAEGFSDTFADLTDYGRT